MGIFQPVMLVVFGWIGGHPRLDEKNDNVELLNLSQKTSEE